jgi:hypothetical protein
MMAGGASRAQPVKGKGRVRAALLGQFVNQNRRRYYENTCVRQKVNPVALSHSPALQLAFIRRRTGRNCGAVDHMIGIRSRRIKIIAAFNALGDAA